MGNKVDWNLIIVIALIISFILALILIVQHQEAKAHEVVVEMRIRDRLEIVLIKWEAGNTPLERLLTVAKDGKGLVVGIGHDVKEHDNLELGERITINEMNTLLQTDLDEALEHAYDLLSDGRNHPQDVRLVIAAMCYQLGRQGTSKFKKMFAAIEIRDYAAAADEMLNSKWAEQTTRRAQTMASIMRGVGE